MRYVPKTSPFPHQAKASIRAARAKNYAMFMEPRLGKTKAALDTVGLLALAGRVKRVLVVCPAIAKDVWEDQIAMHYPHWWHCETFDEEWETQQRIFAGSPPETRFFIAGREETFRRTRGKRGYTRPKQQLLEEWNPDMVILDESHEYQRPGGVAAQDCWRMVRRLRARGSTRNGDKPKPWVILLSGTPNPHGWRPLFAQFRIMDDTLWGTNVGEWDEDHVVYGHGKRRFTIQRYLREPYLERILRENSFTISAEEAGLANKVFHQKLTYTLPPAAARMYLDMVDEFVAEWEEGVLTAKNSGVKRLRLLQILGGFTTDGRQLHRASQDRLKAYATLLLEQGESVVAYSRFTPEVLATAETLENLGFRTLRLDGTTSRADRRVITQALARRPSRPTAVSAQYQAGSTAIELVGAAEVVYVGIPDGWTQYFQSSKRVQGPNQKRPVRLTFLTVPGSVHSLQLRALAKKEDWHATLMRNPKRYLGDLQR